jgi:aspartyl/asparaginyl beta-hydroxylase (cupin superfamily)
MPDVDFAWDREYAVPMSLRFLPTPSGSLQVDGGAGKQSVEVPKDWVALFLAFARSQTAAAAYDAATGEWEIDRQTFQRILRSWLAQGLLRASTTDPRLPSRLALFARTMAAGASPPLQLRSHFPLQQPLEFYPGLDTREIHDRERFPWIAELEGSFSLIQDELSRLLQAGPGFSTVYRSQTSAGEWAAAYLWVFGKPVEETCRRCPETARILAAVPGAAEFGTTLYSALAPHTHIAPHYGLTNAKLRCQLPLRVPAGCKLKVGEHEIEQQEGRCIVFDDSFLHSAWNGSDQPRFVLVFDFFHPDLTGDEIRYLRELAEGKQLAKALIDQAAAGDRVAWVSPDTATPGAGQVRTVSELQGR